MTPLRADAVALETAASAPVSSPARRLNLIPLIGVMWFIVCGGAYGLEPLVSSVGAGWAVLLVAVTPVLWSLPVALMVAELSAAMPEEGGYYVWVRSAMGDFWGVQEGWWTICYTAVDLAIYPVLFVNYLAYFYPSLRLDEQGSTSPGLWMARWLVAVAVIACALLLNWRGARAVGDNALLSLGVVLAPFILIAFAGLGRPGASTKVFSLVGGDLRTGSSVALLTLGLSTVMWNYMGWDNTSTFAGEVNEPQRYYPRALAAALLLTIGAYLLPLLGGLAVTTNPADWSESAGWPVIAGLMGGHWLGVIVAAAALVSSWSLFNSNVFYVSRLPYALARDGWLPAFLARVSKRSGVPVASLCVSCAITAAFSALTFGKLVILDVLLYSAALSLEFAALIVLRVRKPELARPFRAPGGWPGIALITIAPMCCAGIVLYASLTDQSADPRQTLVVCAAIASGIALYLTRRRQARPQDQALSEKNGPNTAP